jgi:hypothetical protein
MDAWHTKEVIHLFRVLFPTWRFFEDVGVVPQLWHRYIGDQSPEEWQLTLPPLKRNYFMLFFNPWGNVTLAYGSLLESLLTDINDLPSADSESVATLTSYKLVRRLVEFKITEGNNNVAGLKYQFRVDTRQPGTNIAQTVLISSLYEVSK